MNRLRPHFAKLLAQKPKTRLQRAIVADYRDDIISLIADCGATLPEVVEAVRAQGEPVLDDGFKSAIRKMLGTVKNIRAGRLNATAFKAADKATQPESPPQSAQISSNDTATAPVDDEDNDAFAARRPRR